MAHRFSRGTGISYQIAHRFSRGTGISHRMAHGTGISHRMAHRFSRGTEISHCSWRPFCTCKRSVFCQCWSFDEAQTISFL